jgi:hypothetical protein
MFKISLMILLTLFSYAGQQYHVIKIPNDDTLSVRIGAGTHNQKIGDLSYNAKNVEVMKCKKAPNGRKWCKVSHTVSGNTMTGWVSAKYLKRSKSDRRLLNTKQCMGETETEFYGDNEKKVKELTSYEARQKDYILYLDVYKNKIVITRSDGYKVTYIQDGKSKYYSMEADPGELPEERSEATMTFDLKKPDRLFDKAKVCNARRSTMAQR